MTSADPSPPDGNASAQLPARTLAHDLVEETPVGLFIVQDERIRFANRALGRMLATNVTDLVGQPHEITLAPDAVEHTRSVIRSRLAGDNGRPGQIRMRRKDGSTFSVRVSSSRTMFEGRPAVLVSVMDITELQQALRSAEWNARMLERAETLCRIGSFEIELPSGRVTLSEGLRSLLGLPARDAVEPTIDDLQWVPPDERALVAGIWRNAPEAEPFDFQHRVACADGRRLVVLHRGQLGAEADGVRRGVAILQDITLQREAEARIQEISSHDEITGLPNRHALLDQIDAAMHAARWEQRGVALLVVDVPRIADIKSSMGFGAGDTLAMALAARLTQLAVAGETVARVGDTEFAWMVESAAADQPAALKLRAHQLQEQLQQPVLLGTTEVFARARVGIARFPVDGETADRLLEAAQTARLDIADMQTAGVAMFTPESGTRALREMQIEAALRHALQLQQFELKYQPQVDLADGAIRGAEALLRWDSPELGAVSPAEFIPVAERSGLIGSISDWVMRRACEQAATWRRAGLGGVRLCVNLSATQLQRPDLARYVQSLLVETGAEPASLGIEVTESVLMADVEGASQVLRELKSIGVEIALDDFGTGFSSLSWLCRLPLDVVKVDRSFVHDVTANAEDVSVTRAIIKLAHSLGLRVLAEGVENDGQLSLLSADGCDYVQGHWFSMAVSPADLERLLREGKRVPERFLSRARRQRTLLVVDDEPNIISALKRLLRRDGYHIVTAHSGAEALQRLTEHDVDVIVSDQRMPGMTGVELLRRAKDLYPHTVRMVLSGYTELQSIIDAVNEGAIYRFLTKPWDDERLRGHVAEAFHQKGMVDENRRLAAQVESVNGDLANANARLAQLLGQQREHAELLAANADSVRALLDDLPAAVIGVDPDGVVVFVNRSADEMLPHAAELLGRHADEVLPAGVLGDDRASAPGGDIVAYAGRHYRLMTRALHGGAEARGRLLLMLLLPSDQTAGVPT